MIIKVCGMREAENIRTVEELRPDWLGFIFWPKSKRYVSVKPEYLPTHAKRVGVFVDADIDEVQRIATDYALDIIQLHGHESPDDLRRLLPLSESSANRRSRLLPLGGDAIAIIKAFNIATADDLKQTEAYEGLADYFLFDTKGKSVGGNGEQFDWSVLAVYNGNTPFLLSGGVGPDDAERIKAFHHPRCIGIDLNSRFELAPGLKDAEQLKAFINKVRS